MVGAVGAFLWLVLIDRKYKLHKLSQGELHLSYGLTRLCHWWKTCAALFFLHRCTVTSPDIKYLIQTCRNVIFP